MPIKLIAIAAALLTVTPAVASADAGRVEVSREVRYSDLDLTNATGRDHLDRRIGSAVRRVCGPLSSRALAEAAQIRRCRREAMVSSAPGRDLAIANSTRRAGMAMATMSNLPALGK